MVAELMLRPDLGKRAYRLRCRFTIGAMPSARTLEKAKYHAAELFVRDMKQQGWEYLDHYGFRMTGPFPATEAVTVPKRSQQARWHIPSHELLPALLAGYRVPMPVEPSIVRCVPTISTTDAWEYELAGVFIRDTILTEVPDPHEEMLR